jgi:hypothetical protein
VTELDILNQCSGAFCVLCEGSKLASSFKESQGMSDNLRCLKTIEDLSSDGEDSYCSEGSLSLQYGQLSESSNHFFIHLSPKICLHLGRRIGCSTTPSGFWMPNSL